MKDLGLANCWKEDPEELKKCREKRHRMQERRSSAWSCYSHYFCEECQIKYEVDSSG